MSELFDPLHAPDANYIEGLFTSYWETLGELADSLGVDELILAEARVGRLREVILGMMLAANGIERPVSTRQINRFLGESQRRALEKTLATAGSPRESIVGRAVALTVIQQWYAPQLVSKYGVAAQGAENQRALQRLAARVPEWPFLIETE